MEFKEDKGKIVCFWFPVYSKLVNTCRIQAGTSLQTKLMIKPLFTPRFWWAAGREPSSSGISSPPSSSTLLKVQCHVTIDHQFLYSLQVITMLKAFSIV